MMRVKNYVAFAEATDIFRLELAVHRKSPNHTKFASQFTARFGRHIAVQLNIFETGRPRDTANLAGSWIDKDSDGANTARHCFNNLARLLRSNITSALRIKIQANHVHTKLGADFRIFEISDATDLDLQSIHIRDFSRDTICWSLAAANKSRRAVSGFFARINCSPIKKP